jgi:hypothetical protein
MLMAGLEMHPKEIAEKSKGALCIGKMISGPCSTH